MPRRSYHVTVEPIVAAAQLPATTMPGDDAARRQLLTERSRTVDQIKRLYAVVMGFAVTTCFGNMYQGAKGACFDGTVMSIIVADGYVFFSIIVLFYLGTERLYDDRYLKPDSRPASLRGLMLDMLSSGITAGWFVILAETFPTPPAGAPPCSMHLIDFQRSQHDFVSLLVILYWVDVGLLACQIARLWYRLRTLRHNAIAAHIVWMVINFVALVILAYRGAWEFQTVQLPDFLWKGLYVDQLAVALVIFHAIRFLADMLSTFQFYYPEAANPVASLLGSLRSRLHV